MKLYKFSEFKINEIGPNMASKAFRGRSDMRTDRIQRDAINAMFRQYIGKSIPFFVKTRRDTPALQYKLIDVIFKKRGDGNVFRYNSTSYNISDESHPNFELHFHSEMGDKNSPEPFADKKRDIIFIYDIRSDNYISETSGYYLNAYAVNFLIKSANIFRQFFYTKSPVYHKLDTQDPNARLKINQELTDSIKKSKLKKDHFRMFSYDSDDLLNIKESIDENEKEIDLEKNQSPIELPSWTTY